MDGWMSSPCDVPTIDCIIPIRRYYLELKRRRSKTNDRCVHRMWHYTECVEVVQGLGNIEPFAKRLCFLSYTMEKHQ